MEKFFAVMVNGKGHTKQEVTIPMFEQRGFKVKKSRAYGSYDVFAPTGQKVATLFSNQIEAVDYLQMVK